MKRVADIIYQKANKREIVLYSCSDMCEALRRMLESYGCKVSFFVDRNHTFFMDLNGSDKGVTIYG
ncbi:hypothetical protein [Ruminiclostridium cellobioparum]|jgi:hypothetical protein|uniref:hypothetical protein n=1 Tax=Ruminiclostridium cellobioparum TaxID=29355 RepID=UPI000484EB8C|nr:hypothetical protein [Ruminiclostridium cellobioparum]